MQRDRKDVRASSASFAPSTRISGRSSFSNTNLIGDGDLVAQHLTLHGTHRSSTMPLLAPVSPSGRAAAWTFIHIWRIADGVIVEHWACRDDMGLVEQLSD
jgi:predicted ester cyclase